MAAQEDGWLQFLETKWSGMPVSRNVGQHPVVAVSNRNLAAAHSMILLRANHDARKHSRSCVAIHRRRLEICAGLRDSNC